MEVKSKDYPACSIIGKFTVGYYLDIDQLLTKVNQQFKRLNVNIILKFDNIKRKVMITGDAKYALLTFALSLYQP